MKDAPHGMPYVGNEKQLLGEHVLLDELLDVGGRGLVGLADVHDVVREPGGLSVHFFHTSWRFVHCPVNVFLSTRLRLPSRPISVYLPFLKV